MWHLSPLGHPWGISQELRGAALPAEEAGMLDDDGAQGSVWAALFPSAAPGEPLSPASSSMALRNSPKRKVNLCFLAEGMRYCSRSKLLRFFRGSVCSSQMRILWWYYTGQKDLGKGFSPQPLQGLCIFLFKHSPCSPALFHRSHLTSFVHITSSFQLENPSLAADASLWISLPSSSSGDSPCPFRHWPRPCFQPNLTGEMGHKALTS